MQSHDLKPPYLVLHPGVTFWIGHRRTQDLRVHPYALRRDFLRGGFCIDHSGRGWRVLGHTLMEPPSLLARLFECNRKVRLELEDRGEVGVEELRAELEHVLESSPACQLSLEEMDIDPCALRKTVASCTTAGEIVACLVELDSEVR